MPKLMIVPRDRSGLVFVGNIISRVTEKCIRLVLTNLDSYRDPNDSDTFVVMLDSPAKLWRARDEVATWKNDPTFTTIAIVEYKRPR